MSKKASHKRNGDGCASSEVRAGAAKFVWGQRGSTAFAAGARVSPVVATPLDAGGALHSGAHFVLVVYECIRVTVALLGPLSSSQSGTLLVASVLASQVPVCLL